LHCEVNPAPHNEEFSRPFFYLRCVRPNARKLEQLEPAPGPPRWSVSH